jgi:hypothetical protein
MDEAPIRRHDRVLVARRSAANGPPLTGTAVGRWITPSNEAVVTVVLDAPDGEGRAIIDSYEAQLVVLPQQERSQDSTQGGR